MKLNDVEGTSPRRVTAVREFLPEQITLLYASEFFDGPLAGLARLAGRELWYCLAEEADDEEATPWFRRYWLVELSADQLAGEAAKHRSFQRHVGTHFDFEGDGARDAAAIRPSSGAVVEPGSDVQ